LAQPVVGNEEMACPKNYQSVKNSIKLKNFPTFNLTTVNVRTAKDDTQLQYLVSKFDLRKLDIICMQEVHRIGNDTVSIESLYSKSVYEVYWQGHKKFHRQGVGICVKKTKHINVIDVKISNNARVMTMIVRIYGFLIKIINVYSPTDSANRQTKL